MDDGQKLATLEWAIECLRPYRNEPGTAEHVHLVMFKRMAAEIRAAEPERVGAVLRAMRDAIDSAKRARARIGYIEVGHMQNLTEGLLGRWWPTIQHALERFESNEEKAA